MVAPPAEQSVFEYIKRRAAELPNLNLIDYQVPYSEIQHYFDRAKIFVYTSEFGTDPAITVLQAGMGGCAILSERLDPDEHMFTEKGAGWCAGGDYCDMVEKLTLLLEDDSLCEELGGSSYKYVAEHYSLDSMVDQYKSVIRGLFDESELSEVEAV